MKKVTIQEAIKANEHSRVRMVGKNDWMGIDTLKDKLGVYVVGVDFILADWEIEEKPLELWANEYKRKDGTLDYYSYDSKEEADASAEEDIIRCVKMREVVE